MFRSELFNWRRKNISDDYERAGAGALEQTRIHGHAEGNVCHFNPCNFFQPLYHARCMNLSFLGAFFPSLAGPPAGLHVAFMVLSIKAATAKPRSLPVGGK
jgi:hypothetical protein